MSVSGLIGSPWKCCLRPPLPGPVLSPRRVPGFSTPSNHRIQFLRLKSGRRTSMGQCAMQASYGGDMTNDQPPVFPRIHVRDPYKRLGISREASEEEINAARNYLIQKYAGHKPSVDSIEKAHNKIIYQHFSVRKDQKVSIFKMFREVGQSRALQGVRSMFQTPDTGFLFQTALVFLVLAFITVRFPTEEGPAAQVTLSLLATMYCLYSRHKNPLRAFIYGAGACIVSWLIATFLMVTVMTVIPTLPFVKGLRGFMVTTSLISYVLLWFFSAYLK